jgi:hypothetical protein
MMMTEPRADQTAYRLSVLERSSKRITNSNPARGIDVRPRFSEFHCPVYVEALRLSDPPSKESYQMTNDS